MPFHDRKGTVRLRDVTAVRAESTKQAHNSKKGYILEVDTPGRVWVFRCAASAERDQWAEAIAAARTRGTRNPRNTTLPGPV